ncbi:hypothetical protein P7C70_g8986, partial [Phenoliferia sp. Uapishka_3]
MLDHVTILTQGGLELWSKSFTPSPSPLNSLIRSALIEERQDSSTTSSSSTSTTSSILLSGYSLNWTKANQSNLIFVVAYQPILNLSYVGQLLDSIKQAFCEDYETSIGLIGQSLQGKDLDKIDCEEKAKRRLLAGKAGWSKLFKGWDKTFDAILSELEAGATKQKKVAPKPTATNLFPSSQPSTTEVSPSSTPTPSNPSTPLDSSQIARNIASLKARQKASSTSSPSRRSGTPTKSTPSTPSSSSTVIPDSTDSPATKAKKEATKWLDSKVSEADLKAYDYSEDGGESNGGSGASTTTTMKRLDGLVSESALGTRSKSGLYQVADYVVGAGSSSSSSSDDDDDSDDEASLPSRRSTVPKPSSTKPTATSPPLKKSLFSTLLSTLSLS